MYELCYFVWFFFFICKCRTWYLNYWYHFHCLWFSIGYGYDTIYFFFLCYPMIWVIECPRQLFVHLLIFFWSPWHLFPLLLVKYMYTNVHLGETHVHFFCLILFLPQLYFNEKVMLMVSWPWMRKVLFEHYYLFCSISTYIFGTEWNYVQITIKYDLF